MSCSSYYSSLCKKNVNNVLMLPHHLLSAGYPTCCQLAAVLSCIHHSYLLSKREIPVVNFTTHAVHCARNIRVCPACKEPVPAADLPAHHDKMHKLCGYPYRIIFTSSQHIVTETEHMESTLSSMPKSNIRQFILNNNSLKIIDFRIYIIKW